MAKDLLLEIGLEEMSAHVVTPSMKQLEEKTTKFSNENQSTYDTIETFSTPRRLAIKVANIPKRQIDSEEGVKEPVKRITLGADGNWTKTAEGLIYRQDLIADTITFGELKGTGYVYVMKYIHGKEVRGILIGLTDVIESLTSSVTMHWAEYDSEYIRPIHWIVALLDDEVVPLEISSIKIDRASGDHRFLGENVILAHTREYKGKLNEQFAIASP